MVVRFGPKVDLGWIVAAVGAGMEVIGWYRISGQPTEAQQLPYLASATMPGAALIVAGAVLVAARRRPGDGAAGADEHTRTASARRTTRREGLWAVPDGSYLHRSDCPLLDGKPDAFEVTGDQDGQDVTAPARACPVCDPELVNAS